MRARRALIVGVVLWAVPPGGPEPLAAQDGFWRQVLGSAPDRRRVIPAMWALHPYEPHFPEADWTGGIGVQLSTFFGATFVNSYGARSWIAGVERNWVAHHDATVRFGVGYRVGAVTGYDERLLRLASSLPAMPFAGVLAWTRIGPLGIDFFSVYRAISLESSISF